MPIRVTPRGLILISYDSASKEWHSQKEVGISALQHPVEIEPGTTLSDLFDGVEACEQLKAFTEEYCGCDIGPLHERDRTQRNSAMLPIGWEEAEGGGVAPTKFVEADTLTISRSTYLSKEPEDDFYRKKTSQVMTVALSTRDVPGVTMVLPHNSGRFLLDYSEDPLDCEFGALCQMHLAIDAIYRVSAWNEEDDDEFEIVSALWQFRLIDLLSAVYGIFGTTEFDERYQDQIEDQQDFMRRMRDAFEGNDDEEE